uniref:Uncharacterized protein n=1 Tax=Micrurus lemniscatus lemniscatus TaxID=129467 RepID=A0A2D4HW74_MICLE
MVIGQGSVCNRMNDMIQSFYICYRLQVTSTEQNGNSAEQAPNSTWLLSSTSESPLSWISADVRKLCGFFKNNFIQICIHVTSEIAFSLSLVLYLPLKALGTT